MSFWTTGLDGVRYHRMTAPEAVLVWAGVLLLAHLLFRRLARARSHLRPPDGAPP